MVQNLRYNCWLIQNIVFSAQDFTKVLEYNGEKIELLITNYENSKKLTTPLKDWIHESIIPDAMNNLRNNPSPPLNSIFIVTKKPFDYSKADEFAYLFRLCLKIVYFQPTLISNTIEYFPNFVATGVIWTGFKDNFSISKTEINTATFDKVILYFNILKKLPRNRYFILEEIYKISQIDDSIIELLSLYSFIEGFWFDYNSKESNITASFYSMLKNDYASGKENNEKRKEIITKIESQNSAFRNRKLDSMRHLLAHGMYKKLEDNWTSEQWQIINEQRNLLFDLVFESLINKINKS